MFCQAQILELTIDGDIGEVDLGAGGDYVPGAVVHRQGRVDLEAAVGVGSPGPGVGPRFRRPGARHNQNQAF